MHIKRFVFNPFQVNTYLLSDNDGNALVIDPAMMDEHENTQFTSWLKEHKLQLNRMLLTHGHVDHISGTAFLKSQFEIPAEGHNADAFLLASAESHARSFGLETIPPAPLEKNVTDGQKISCGTIELEARHVPGHSPGSLAFIHHESKSVFCGDALFAGSIGRTDLPQGDYDQLIASIKTTLLSLADEYTVYPGHGPESSIGAEKMTNPFLR